MPNDQIKVHERIAALETKVDSLLDNHLPHLEKRMGTLSKQFWGLIVLLVANLLTFIIK